MFSQTESLTGRWGAVSTVSVDGCGLSDIVTPIGFPLCALEQSGESVGMTCAEGWCGGLCAHPSGTVVGDSVTLTSVRTVLVDSKCSVQVTETDSATLSGQTLSGQAMMTVNAVGECFGRFPCLMQGSFVLTRFRSDALFPACVLTCQ